MKMKKTEKGMFMMTVCGYINGNLTKELYKEFVAHGATTLVIETEEVNESDGQTILDALINGLSEGDQLIIYNVSNLKKTLFELAIFFKILIDRDVELVILNKDELFNTMTDTEFFEFIIDLCEENKRVVQEKTKIAERKNRQVGRPRVSDETIEKIRYLRTQKNYTLQDTAKICDVSLGTVYKYTDAQNK